MSSLLNQGSMVTISGFREVAPQVSSYDMDSDVRGKDLYPLPKPSASRIWLIRKCSRWYAFLWRAGKSL